MRIRAGLLCSTIFAAAIGLSFDDSGRGFGVGVTSAEAKAFSTRKRVKGRWVTGRFGKRSSEKAAVAEKAEPARAKRHKASRSQASAKSDSKSDSSKPEESSAPERTTRAEPAAQPSPAAFAPARLAAEPVPRPAVTAAFAAPVAASLALQAAAPAGLAEPTSVTFDLQAATRTTVYADGRRLIEPFDRETMRRLAAEQVPAPLSQDERLRELQRGLEIRARAMSGTGSIPQY
jgi:hypothetical protein